MLALNVSAKIINAFFVINDGIKNSNSIFDDSHVITMSALEKNVEQDKGKYQPLLDVAKEDIKVLLPKIKQELEADGFPTRMSIGENYGTLIKK
jgi:hypothetical protein